jgi:hypothetical protein
MDTVSLLHLNTLPGGSTLATSGIARYCVTIGTFVCAT